MNEKENKKEKRVITNVLLLIILFIILSFLVKHFGLIEVKTPTGNVDIFDIIVGEQNNTCKQCGCAGGCNCKDNVEKSAEQNTNYGVGQVPSIKTNTGIGGKTNNASNNEVIVYDEDVQYSKETKLNIFTHKSYDVAKGVIAPGTENAYQFIIRNNNDFAIKYALMFNENNEFDINMKYRLKINGKYIVGNDGEWKNLEELKQSMIVLDNKTYNVYTLEWKWVESDNDTEIGKNIEAQYGLNMVFNIERYE